MGKIGVSFSFCVWENLFECYLGWGFFLWDFSFCVKLFVRINYFNFYDSRSRVIFILLLLVIEEER